MPEGNNAIECVEGLPMGADSERPDDPDEPEDDIGLSKCYPWTAVFGRPRPFHEVLAYLHWSGKRLALAVDDPADAPKVETMRDFISKHWYPPMWFATIPCINLERPIFSLSDLKNGRAFNHGINKTRLPCEGNNFVPLPMPHPGLLPSFANLTHPTIFTAQELEAYFNSRNYGNKGLLYGAVVFKSIGGDGTLGAPGHWEYSIRLNTTTRTSPMTKGTPKTRPLELGLKVKEAKMYMQGGFMSLQLLIDRYIIGARSSTADTSSLLKANDVKLSRFDLQATREQLAEPLHYLPQSVESVPMPVAGVLVDGFYQLIAAAFPIVFIVAFLYTQKTIINELITEKETKVRETLRMLGVSSLSIFGSWFATYGMIFLVICGVFAVVAGLEIFPSSSGTLVFVFFWLWSMSFLAFALFVHAFFNQARTGGIVGVILMFVQWIVYASQNRKDNPASPFVMQLMMFMPNAAFCAGLDMLSKYEASKIGATWHNLNLEVENSTFGAVLVTFCADIVIWTFLGWYLDRVLPKEYGARMPLFFPCLPSYWRAGSEARSVNIVSPSDAAAGEQEHPVARAAGHNTVEDVSDALKSRSQASGVLVRTAGLRREFSTPGGVKVAVAGLDITMYEGQILAFLGHNGAGKSTTINMLIGMVAPSSGDAQIAGHSIRTSMRQIRRIIGVCPQHDVLWLELTVLEHLYTYARLRNVPASDVGQRAQEMLEAVGLTEKVQTRAGSLSGGQKRKLSLCLALIGKPRVVFLDEPTSGMDPFSRRFTWNIIRSIREGRVTVLTTHFMDEADILGDRIAVIADGVLQCCGSSLFLKNRFGAGYRLTCSRKKTANGAAMGAASAQVAPLSSDAVLGAIRKHVPQMEVLTDVGAELSVRLPVSSAGRFPNMLDELDRRLDEFGLEHYGLSMVTLEEVFLRIANGGMEELDSQSPTTAGAAMPTTDVKAKQESAASAHEASTADSVVGSCYTEEPDTAAPNVSNSEVLVIARHLGSLFAKRVRYSRRDFKSLLCMVLLPVAWLAFGLALLQYFGQRYMPPVALDMVEQYGWGHKVGYNASGSDRRWANTTVLDDLGQAAGVSVLYEAIPADLDHGMVFGRNYTKGLPNDAHCEEHPEFLGKCWRQDNLCKPLWPQLKAARAVGFNIGCTTDAWSCRAAIEDECAEEQHGCIAKCMTRGRGMSRSVCSTQCKQLCHQFEQVEWLCGLLWDPLQNRSRSVAWLCPESCVDEHNPEACMPGSRCGKPGANHAADPAGVLAFERLLFEQGQGTPREDVRYGAVKAAKTPGVGATLTLVYNTSGLHIVPSLLNLASSSLKRVLSGGGSSISTSNHPMPLTVSGDVNKVVDAVINLFSSIVVIEAFSFIPAAVVAYIVRERESHHNSKHQQLISGVSLLAYWVANLLWDMIVYAAPMGLSMLIIYLMGIDSFTQNGAFQATFVIFLGYGLSITPFTYLLSFLFEKHTTAQVICLVANFITGLLLVQISYILSIIEATKDVNEILMWVFRFFPGFSLGHGLLQICTNSVLAGLLGTASEVDLLGWDVAGKDMLYLFLTAPLYFVLAIVMDYALHSPLSAASRHFDPVAVVAEEEDEDEDVRAEAARVVRGEADEDMIRLVNLRKVYRTPEGIPKLAVRNLSFGLPRGECFGFLGINGAGKTSTLNMLTGAVLPSDGQAFLGGYDVVKEQWKVRRLMGYCPQHDALLDRLTVREHLHLFGRIKGIPRLELEHYCESMMQELSLTPHMNKLSMTLSGGNKRKLSLAIAMMGSPPLVFLDEPSTGVDPAARRLMWNVIADVSTRRCRSSVMLTTHNMEEAEALCTTIGIMVGGRLRCFGSNQHLKARFSNGYQLEARLQCVGSGDIKAFIKTRNIPDPLARHDVESLCSQLGDAKRAAWVREGCEEGHLVYDALARFGNAPATIFAEWWLLEDRTKALTDFLEDHFPGTVSLERHDRTLRYRLPGTCNIASVFRCLENAREKLALEEYGMSQTSLEQIFNEFASTQQEERGAAPGLIAVAGSAEAPAAAAESGP